MWVATPTKIETRVHYLFQAESVECFLDTKFGINWEALQRLDTLISSRNDCVKYTKSDEEKSADNPKYDW